MAAPNDPQTQLCPAAQGCLALYCQFPKGVLLTLGKAVQKEPPLAAPNVSQNRLRPAGQPATVLLSSLVAVLLGMFATLGWAVQKRSPSPTHGPVQ